MNLQQLEQGIDKLSIEDLEEIYFSLGDYEEIPVDIETFCTDPEFLGEYFAHGFRPYWLEVLKEIYPSPTIDSNYFLIVLKGSIGRGKTVTAAIGMLYDAYRLLCLKEPQLYMGLAQKTRLMNMLFNVTLKLTEDVGFDTLQGMMKMSPYFQEQIAKAPKYMYTPMLPKRVDFRPGSNLTHTLGKAVFSVMLDEANFGANEEKVYDTFNSLLRRMQSRFLPGKIWITSSERATSSMVNRLIKQFENDSRTYIDGNTLDTSALWHVVPKNFGTETFKVFIGTPEIAPRIVEENDTAVIENYPDFIIDVPLESISEKGNRASIRDEFVRDIHMALQDLAGVSTTSTYRLFKLRDRLNNAFKVGAVFPDTIQLDFDNEQDQIHGHILYNNYFDSNPYGTKPRTIHIDIGISGDRLGIAATVLLGFEKKKLLDPKTFEYIDELVPKTRTEWAFGIEHKPGQQVPLYKVRAFLFWLTKKKYPIQLISLDGYQSTDFMQIMQKNGYNTELVSVDREVTAYMNLRESVYRGLHDFPMNGVLKTEMNELEVIEEGKKINHPINGSKDCADACAGSHFTMNRDAHNYKFALQEDEIPTATDRLKETLWEIPFGN
jgi:hypothetical protein